MKKKSFLEQHVLPQFSTYSCGPAALRCALLAYGDRVDGRRLALLANTTKEGTDEDGLRAAAAVFDLKIKHERVSTAAVAALRIKERLHEGKPILLCVDSWTHWVAAVPMGRFGSTRRHVWICDPARDEEQVMSRYTWRQALQRVCVFELPDRMRFDLYVLELT